MSHCGGRIKRDNVAGGKEKGEVLFMQTEVLKGLWAGVRGIIGRFWWVFRPHCGGWVNREASGAEAERLWAGFYRQRRRPSKNSAGVSHYRHMTEFMPPTTVAAALKLSQGLALALVQVCQTRFIHRLHLLFTLLTLGPVLRQTLDYNRVMAQSCGSWANSTI